MCGCKSNYIGTDDYAPCTCSDNTVSYVGDDDFMENFRGRRKGNAKLRKKLGRKTLAGKVLRIGMLGSPMAPLVIGETIGGRIKKGRSRKARRRANQKAAEQKPEQSPLPILGNQMPEPQYNQPEMEDPGMLQVSEPEPQAPEEVPEEAPIEEQTEEQEYMSSFASPDEEKKKKDRKIAIIIVVCLFFAALIIFVVTRNFRK